MRRWLPVVRSVLSVLLLAALPAAAGATWSTDPSHPAVVSNAIGYQFESSACADGAGGTFVVWADQRSGNFDVYAQHLDAHGTSLWAANGIAVASALNDQDQPAVCRDAAGGVFVAWRDARLSTLTRDIYVLRLGPSGAPVAGWPAGGLGLPDGYDDSAPLITADGLGGAFIAWPAKVSGTDTDPYIDHVSASAVAWGGPAAGSGLTSFQYPTALVVSGGDAYMLWNDNRNGNVDLYLQRYNLAGTALLTGEGRQLTSGVADETDGRMVAGVAGGVVISYDDFASIYTIRVNPAGGIDWGPATQTGTSYRSLAAAVSDGTGGMLLFWDDHRSGGFISTDLYATHLQSNGLLASGWLANGNLIASSIPAAQAAAVVDGSGGALIAWTGFGNRGFLHLDGSGVAWPGWPSSGRILSITPGNIVLAGDGAQGAVAFLEDFAGGSELDLYAHHFERFGQLGEPAPTIASVKDVKNDQGGNLKVSWNASYLDAAPDLAVYSYDVWRSVPAAAAQRALAQGALSVAADDVPPADVAPGRRIAAVPMGAQTTYWEYVGRQTAGAQPGYSYVVPTLGDSIGSSNPYTLVKVRAIQLYSSAFWESAPDSGYSVDNLPPVAPAPFTGTYVVGTGASLFWGANAEVDLAGYRLYRGFSPGFVPGPSNLVTQKPSPGFLDSGAPPAYYKLSAYDIHGNESGFALLLPGGTLAVEPGAVPSELALAPVAPNPVRGVGRIGYALPRATRVSVAVFDAQGRRVRTLVEGEQAAGTWSARWDGRDEAGASVGSGVYFVRMTAEGRRLTQRLAYLR